MKTASPSSHVASSALARVRTRRLASRPKADAAADPRQQRDQTAHQPADHDHPADGLVLHDREDDVGEVGQQFRGCEHGEPHHRTPHQRLDGALGEHGEHKHDQGRDHACKSINIHGH